jgi:hypothetical protein
MDKTIVVTTINKPTTATKKFSKVENSKLIIVGDNKTPSSYKLDNCDVITIEDQIKLNYKILKYLPFNHYSRKNIGYIYSIKEYSSKYIFDSDDDNILYDELSYPVQDNEVNVIDSDQGFINIYKHFTNDNIWPRGLPLNCIKDKNSFSKIKTNNYKVPIIQTLADGDTDVDSIYRFLINKEVTFKKNMLFLLEKGTVCPFNSQSTIIRNDVLPLMYLPYSVSFRFTDILRGIIAQPILWAHGMNLGFSSPILYQDRNEHNLMKDFESEVSMFLNVEQTYEIACSVSSSQSSIADNLYNIYVELIKNNIVGTKEEPGLEAWLCDIS